MPYFILGIALLIGYLLISRWYLNASPSMLLRVLKWSAIFLVTSIVIFFLITGPKVWALWALPVLIPWLLRARALARAAKNWSRMTNSNVNGSSAPNQSSEIETKFFRMYLDHQTGEMNGEVLRGIFSDQTLRNLPLNSLLVLFDEVQEDEQSVQVLTTYLDRYYVDEWREGKRSPGENRAGGGSMTVEQACEILGLKANASDEEIKEAHHRLMNINHPDHGGSTFLAAQINQAKDILLGG